MHIISKLVHNADLYLQPSPEVKARRPRLKYGNKINYSKIPEDLLRKSTTEDDTRTDIYQANCLHKRFADKLNVVIIVRTDLKTNQVGHVVLFSSDLSLDAETLIDYYALRFQIEFTFRDAKQYFGMEDFMGVKETSVANAVGLSFFMVNLSTHLVGCLRENYPGAGISDLKSYYQIQYYIAEFKKLMSENPDIITCSSLVDRLCSRIFIHSTPNRDAELEIAA